MKIIKLKNLQKQEKNFLLKRSKIGSEGVLNTVNNIINQVRSHGDQSLQYYTQKLDGVKLDNFKVEKQLIRQSLNQVDREIIEALKKAAANIEKFHKAQLPPEWICNVQEGISAGQIVRPLESVGCYIPGGRAVYPSSVLMTVIPAKIAGVPQVICCSPPLKNGKVNDVVLAAAHIAGADEIYSVGGAQAIAAMAYGTESVPAVDKIVGPGNIFVTTAKKMVYGDVDIDFPAGPSEVLIIADETSNPEYIVLDLLAQAEHDTNAAVVLITTSEDLIMAVEHGLQDMINKVPRKEIIEESLQKYGMIILVDSIEEAIEFSNNYAPEHLMINTSNLEEVLKKIRNAGSIFLGELTPVAAGDYGSGTNHVLPTAGCARMYSGLSTETFLKKPTIQRITPEGLRNLRDVVIPLAEYEGLYNHAESFKKRLEHE